MLLKNLIADVEARAGVSKAFQLILGASLLTNILLAGVFATMDKTVRTILMPPEISKSFWVDGKHLGQEYLDQMGSWVIQQFASVTPSTIDFQTSNILKYVHPSVHGDLSVRFKAGAQRLKAENLSRLFMPREVRISEEAQAVALIGYQESWVSDKRLPGENIKAYLVKFDYDGSKVTIKELRETDPQHPFDPPKGTALDSSEAAPETQRYQESAAPQTQEQAIAPPNTIPQAPAIKAGNLPPAPPPPTTAATQAALQNGTPILSPQSAR